MKQSLELSELLATAQHQSKVSLDYLPDTRQLEAFIPDSDEQIAIRFAQGAPEGQDPNKGFPLTTNAHAQIASRLKVPKVYYDRMLQDAPALLCRNINHWFTNEPEFRMLRTLEGRIRAFVSDKYRVLDNWPLMSHILPVLGEREDIRIESCHIGEDKLYLKAVMNEQMGEIATGDVVKNGIVISNSETGNGSLRVEPLTYILSCSNGMISSRSIKKYHTGARQRADENWEVFSDETKKLSDDAFWNQAKDIVRASMTDVDFQQRIDEINSANEDKLSPRKLNKTVTAVQKKYNLADEQGEAIMERLITGQEGLTRWGLSQAVTYAAQGVEDYELATHMERVGGLITEMNSGTLDRLVRQLSK